MSQLNALIATNCALLSQGREAMAIDGGFLYQADPAATQGQIGAHFRHVLEHYREFLAGLETGLINYDDRARDGTLEVDSEVARAVSSRIIADLERLATAHPGRPLQVNVAVATTTHGTPQWSPSTLARELSFLLSHTIHHYALIALQARLRGVELGEDFGVAPSTLEYRASLLATTS